MIGMQVWLSFLKGETLMSEKRRDNRNRILREGEYQRKDGRYRFRYIDEDGKEKMYIAGVWTGMILLLEAKRGSCL